MEQNTLFEIVVLFMGIAILVLLAVYKIKSTWVKGKQRKLLNDQLMTFVDKGYTNLEDEKGRDILYLASVAKLKQAVAGAIEKGADPNRLYNGQALLRILARDHHWAVENTARALLDGGALPNGPKGPEASPLWECAASNHTGMAILLIEYGAGINILAATSGSTPLMTAVYEQSVGVGRILIKAGADLHIKDKKGRQAVDFAHTNKDFPSGPTGDTAGPTDTHFHEYNELVRQIRYLMAGKSYKYKKFKPKSSPETE